MDTGELRCGWGFHLKIGVIISELLEGEFLRVPQVSPLKSLEDSQMERGPRALCGLRAAPRGRHRSGARCFDTRPSELFGRRLDSLNRFQGNPECNRFHFEDFSDQFGVVSRRTSGSPPFCRTRSRPKNRKGVENYSGRWVRKSRGFPQTFSTRPFQTLRQRFAAVEEQSYSCCEL